MMTMRGIMMNAKDLDGGGTEIDVFASMNKWGKLRWWSGRRLVHRYGHDESWPWIRAARWLRVRSFRRTRQYVHRSLGCESERRRRWRVYRDSKNTPHGFVRSGAGFESVDVPSALSTRAFGINESGTVVGNYTDANNKVRGFVAVRRP
jgi:hypothetical protein